MSNSENQTTNESTESKAELFDINIHDSHKLPPDPSNDEYRMPAEIIAKNILKISKFSYNAKGDIVSYETTIKSMRHKNNQVRASSEKTYTLWVNKTESRPERIKFASNVRFTSSHFTDFYQSFDKKIKTPTLFASYIKKMYDRNAAKKIKLPIIINDHVSNPIWVNGIIFGDDEYFKKETGGPQWEQIIEIIEIEKKLSQEEIDELRSACELAYSAKKDGTEMYKIAKGDPSHILKRRLPPKLFEIENRIFDGKNKKSKKHSSTIASITMKDYFIFVYTPDFHDKVTHDRKNHGFHCTSSKSKIMTSDQQQSLQHKYSTPQIPTKKRNTKQYNNDNTNNSENTNNNTNNNIYNNDNNYSDNRPRRRLRRTLSPHGSPPQHANRHDHRHHPYSHKPSHKSHDNYYPSNPNYSNKHYYDYNPPHPSDYDPYYHQHEYVPYHKGYNSNYHRYPSNNVPPKSDNKLDRLIHEQRQTNDLFAKYLMDNKHKSDEDASESPKSSKSKSNTSKSKKKKKRTIYTMERVYILTKSMDTSRKRLKKKKKEKGRIRSKEYYNETDICKDKYNLDWSGRANLKVKTKQQIYYFHSNGIKIGMNELSMKPADWCSNYKNNKKRTPPLSINTLSDITNKGLSKLEAWDTADKYPSDLMDIFVASIDDDSSDSSESSDNSESIDDSSIDESGSSNECSDKDDSNDIEMTDKKKKKKDKKKKDKKKKDKKKKDKKSKKKKNKKN